MNHIYSRYSCPYTCDASVASCSRSAWKSVSSDLSGPNIDRKKARVMQRTFNSSSDDDVRITRILIQNCFSYGSKGGGGRGEGDNKRTFCGRPKGFLAAQDVGLLERRGRR